MEQRKLTIQTLEKATDGFGNSIGAGAFGEVFKGTLDGQEIAVKKFHDTSRCCGQEFHNILEIMGMVKHENIVKQIGFCFSPTAKFICYEYLQKGSIDRHIYGEPSKSILGWDKRFRIIDGVCRGLQFLHEQEKTVIHADLKPENILLGNNMEAKLADFDLSRLFGEEVTHVTTRSKYGTLEYMAPEQYWSSVKSKDSDVYSLGIIIFEITTGKRNRLAEVDVSGIKFIEMITQERKGCTQRSYVESMYPSLDADGHDQVERCLQIAHECVQNKRSTRPSIRKIIERLKGSGASSHATNSGVSPIAGYGKISNSRP